MLKAKNPDSNHPKLGGSNKIETGGSDWIETGGSDQCEIYSFNGKLKDNEIEGEGDVYDYGMRMYDSRLGRFLSIDPIANKFPWWSTYCFAGNTPIKAVDLDGKEIFVPLEFPIEPIISIPRVGPIPLPPNITPLPPLIGPIPDDLTVGQPKAPSANNTQETDWTKVDRSKPETWPKLPPNFKGEPKFGEPSREKPKSGGEKSAFDEEGGEWRPHTPDDNHPEGHWDYKPPGKNAGWQNISERGERLTFLEPVNIQSEKPSFFQKILNGIKEFFKTDSKESKIENRVYA